VAGQQRREERLQLMKHRLGLIGPGQGAAGGGQAGAPGQEERGEEIVHWAVMLPPY